MTPESVLLQGLGRTLLKDLAQCTTITLLYGLFVVLFLFSVITPLRRGVKARTTWIMLCTTFTSFICVSLYWGAFLASFVLDIRGILLDQADAPLDKSRFVIVAQQQFVGDQITLWAPLVLIIPSDCIVVWRAWVLFSEKRWVLIAPIVLLLALIATVFTNLIASTSLKVFSRADDLFTASISLSMATNLLSTSLIMYKLWTHRRFFVQLQLGQRRTPSGSSKILIIFIESGLLYFVFQVTGLIFQVVPVSRGNAAFSTAMNIFFPTYCIVTGMYPMVVVLLVKRQRSIVETFGFSMTLEDNGAGRSESTGAHPATLGHLSFASPPVTASGAWQSGASWAAIDLANGTSTNAQSVRVKRGGTTSERHTVTAPF